MNILGSEDSENIQSGNIRHSVARFILSLKMVIVQLVVLPLMASATHAAPVLFGDGANEIKQGDIDAIASLCAKVVPKDTPTALYCKKSSDGVLREAIAFYKPTESSHQFFRGTFVKCIITPDPTQRSDSDFIAGKWTHRMADAGTCELLRMIEDDGFSSFPPTEPFVLVQTSMPSEDTFRIFDTVCRALGAFSYRDADRLGAGIQIWKIHPEDKSAIFFSNMAPGAREITVTKNGSRWYIPGINLWIYD